ncbi:efflux RND transporter periplasmic adaptor subunit [uncultured Salinisphaera sp.]|uniref:efflux RND transporter periplasmic adaptor subunit n=1 Tax=uncultured Salinisphaera sp. TaxID=359372 RepID=UPI0032B0F23E|tara:strand:- start:12918 stop:14252 length:1335 start_codon:yes stop_codon:yes gene_type:complete
MSETENPAASSKRSITARLLAIGLPLAVLVAAVVLGALFFANRPQANRSAAPDKPKARLVTVAPAEPAPATLRIAANGTVEAAQATELRARVSGQILSLTDDLAPGTRFEKDDVLARIDPADYELALDQAQTELAKARASLETENGQQAVAQRELELVGADNVSDKERNLALRGPQLASARADVRAAESQVDQARLDLSRTRVQAPFDGIVTARSAAVGDVVSSTETLANLAATEAYWVNLSLPVDQLRWLHAADASDDEGSAARIYYRDAWGPDAYLSGHVLRVQAQLEEQGRLARVLVKVAHPLGAPTNDNQALLLGAYVTARIAARMPADSVVVDASLVRENDQIWIMSDDETLDIRQVNVVYRDDNQAVISGDLAPGTLLVTSDLSAPIQGMPLRVEDSTARPAEPDSQTASDQASAAPATLRMTPAYTALAATDGASVL